MLQYAEVGDTCLDTCLDSFDSFDSNIYKAAGETIFIAVKERGWDCPVEAVCARTCILEWFGRCEKEAEKKGEGAHGGVRVFRACIFFASRPGRAA